jgi:hypothetical protein
VRVNWAFNGSDEERAEVRRLERSSGLTYDHTEVWPNGVGQSTCQEHVVVEPQIVREP